jgi:hypothetical protein
MPADPPIVIADWINNLKKLLEEVADKKNNLDRGHARKMLADIEAGKVKITTA